MILLWIYKIIITVLSPFIRLHIFFRVLLEKEDKTRYLEKFAISNLNRPKKNLIWLHAVSLGELNLLIPIIQGLHKKVPNHYFLVTTSTLTAAKAFKSAKLPNSIHQFLPIDAPLYIRRFLKHWKPNMAVFSESELWPNIIIEVSKRMPLILVNARLSDKSYKRWRFFNSLAVILLKRFTFILSGTKSDYKKFKNFTNDNLKYVGNIKDACPPLDYSKELYQLLADYTKDKIVFLAASTHPGEEEIIMRAHKKIKQQYPNLFTIIVPRHIERGREIYEIADNMNLTASLYTDGKLKPNIDIYIGDCIGKLGTFYRLAPLVFVGGSLVKHGGQNILEPAKLGCAIIVGKYTHNFKDIVNDFLSNDSIIVVNNEKDFKQTLQELLGNKSIIDKLSKKVLQISSKSSTKAIDETIKYILDLNNR